MSFRFLLLVLFFALACKKSEDEPVESKADPNALKSSPEFIVVNSDTLILEAYVWRDFMPISPPDGKPMICGSKLIDLDSTDLVENISPLRQHVIYMDQVWSESEIEVQQFNKYSKHFVIRNGPKWGPDVLVDVVLEFQLQGQRYSIQAKQQNVDRTD